MVKFVKVGGIRFPVSVVNDLRDGDMKLDGHIKYRPYSIRLDADLGEDGTRIVLWHEILHAIMEQAGIVWKEKEEQICEALAYGIVQALDDNPELVPSRKGPND